VEPSGPARLGTLDLGGGPFYNPDIAGSNEAGYDLVNKAGILPRGDIRRCPAQYQEDVENFTQVLDPHVKGELNFQAPSN
jgi:hypothetical protein